MNPFKNKGFLTYSGMTNIVSEKLGMSVSMITDILFNFNTYFFIEVVGKGHFVTLPKVSGGFCVRCRKTNPSRVGDITMGAAQVGFRSFDKTKYPVLGYNCFVDWVPSASSELNSLKKENIFQKLFIYKPSRYCRTYLYQRIVSNPEGISLYEKN